MGGSARTWRGTLRAPARTLALRLVMTKFGAPAVRIRWALRVERQG